MSDTESVQELLKCWRAGDPAAAEAIHRRYAQRLCALVEPRIGDQLRRRVDAEDIVQSVFRTFFRRVGDGQFHIDHTSSLWHLLVGIGLKLAAPSESDFHRFLAGHAGVHVAGASAFRGIGRAQRHL